MTALLTVSRSNFLSLFLYHQATEGLKFDASREVA